MVIDDSTARAAIRKQVSVYNRRMATIMDNKSSKISRKLWFKQRFNYINQTSWIIDAIDVGSNTMNYIVLSPDARHLHTSLVLMNLKKMELDIKDLNLIYTEHFIIRLMQYRKTINFNQLTPDAKIVLHAMLSLLEYISDNMWKSGEFGIYIDQIGFIAVVYEHNEEKTITIKTLIPPDLMGYKHKEKYAPLKGTGNISIIRIGELHPKET